MCTCFCGSADLEFGREDNPGVDGSAAVDALLSLLRDALRDRFGLEMQASLMKGRAVVLCIRATS